MLHNMKVVVSSVEYIGALLNLFERTHWLGCVDFYQYTSIVIELLARV